MLFSPPAPAFETGYLMNHNKIQIGEDVTIYQGDCLEVMKTMEDKSVDAVITDPPYGINIVGKNATIGGTSKEVSRLYGQINHKHNEIIGDDKPIDPQELLRVSDNQIIFGGNYIADKLPPTACWIVWYKRIKNQCNNFADAELAWTSFKSPTRVFQYLWMGMLRDGEIQKCYHPTQKPVELMAWIIKNYTQECDTIFDPFMGSGSTVVACVRLGRKFIGIEIEPKYVEIAKKRILAEVDKTALIDQCETMEIK